MMLICHRFAADRLACSTAATLPRSRGRRASRPDSCHFPFLISHGTVRSCYYCPATEPTPDDPVPSPREGDTRHTLPSDCQTAWFDPIANRCLCDSDNCAFTDETRPIGQSRLERSLEVIPPC